MKCFVLKKKNWVVTADEQIVHYGTFELIAEAEHWWIAKKEHLQLGYFPGVIIPSVGSTSKGSGVHRSGSRIDDNGTVCCQVH